MTRACPDRARPGGCNNARTLRLLAGAWAMWLSKIEPQSGRSMSPSRGLPMESSAFDESNSYAAEIGRIRHTIEREEHTGRERTPYSRRRAYSAYAMLVISAASEVRLS